MANFNQPKRQQIIDAYRNGTDEQKKVLEELFGEIEPKNVMERVKTFEDACRELGKGHEYVKDYRALCAARINIPTDVIAYYKLRIICAALNEGWKPDYTDSLQCKYSVWFSYADEDYAKRHPGEKWHKVKIVYGSSNNVSTFGSFCVHAGYSPSTTSAYLGSLLCLKSRELALYFGEQFFDICKDFYL